MSGLKLKVIPMFPAAVQGAGGIEVVKENGIYIIQPAEGVLGGDVWGPGAGVNVAGRYAVFVDPNHIAPGQIAGGYLFRSVTGDDVIPAGTTLAAIQRNAPAATSITLPSVTLQSQSMAIVDWSTGITAHTITLHPAPGETVMNAPTGSMFSSNLQLASARLVPSTDLMGWYFA